jgi:hypothetical protein
MAGLFAECGNHADTVLTAFMRGDYQIRKADFEAAYRSSTGSVLGLLVKPVHGGLSATGKALEAATRLGRLLAKDARFSPARRRVHDLGLVHRNAPMHRIMFDAAFDLAISLIGGDIDPSATAEAARTVERIVGYDLLSDREPSTQQREAGTRWLGSAIEHTNFPALARLVMDSTEEELHLAREQARAFRDFAWAFAAFDRARSGSTHAFPWFVIGRATDRPLAWALPVFVWLRKQPDSRLDEIIDFLAAWTPWFRSARRTLHRLPRELHVIVQDGGYASLSRAQQADLARRFRLMEVTLSDDLARVVKPPEIPFLWDNSVSR